MGTKNIIERAVPEVLGSFQIGSLECCKGDFMFAERRIRQRYRIEQDICYKCLSGGQITDEGTGKIVDISSAGVRFTTAHALKVGSIIELSMKWPVLLDDKCLLKLEIFGSVVRSDSNEAAVKIAHYEFRTRSSNAFPGLPDSSSGA